MSKVEDKRRAAMKAATDLFANMEQEEANNYFTENLMITQITKAHMAAYIKKYVTTDADKKWTQEEFKKASFKTVPKQVNTVCVDASGIPLRKYDKKTGKAIPVTKRVNSVTGEMITRYDLSGARKEFISHFGITPKANKFTAKAKRTEAIFDEFADIF